MKRRFWPALLLLGFGTACEDEGPLQLSTAMLRHPEVLDFGAVPVGTGRSLRFMVENVGTGPATVLGFSSSSSAEVQVSPSQFFVVPGDAVEVTVRYSPARLSLAPVSIPLEMRTDLSEDEGRRTLRLIGRGIRDGLSFDPNPLDFGRVVRGRTSTRSVTVTSLLPEPIELRLLEVSPRGGDGDFAVRDVPIRGEPVALGALKPGDAFDLEVTYTPAPGAGDAEDRAGLVFTFCEDPARCRAELPLRGEAVTGPLICAPNPVDFGALRAARARSELVACVNQSQRSILVEAARAESREGVEFSVPLAAPRRLEPGQRETFEVRAVVDSSASVGPRVSQAFFSTRDALDGLRTPDTEVGLRLRVGDAALRWSPQALDFGRVAVGQEGRAELSVENVGTDALNLATQPIDAPFFSPVQVLSLAGGETKTLVANFRPGQAGPAAGVLRIETDAPEQRELEVAVGGVGLELEPCEARLEPAIADFGPVLLHRTVTRGVQVRNVGPHPCLVREGALSSGTPPDFELVEGGGQDILLMPGEAWTFVIAYRARSFGLVVGELGAKISNEARPTVIFGLRGTGVRSALVLDPDEIDFGEQAPECVGRQRVRVFNPGPGAVSLTALRLVSASNAPSPFTLDPFPEALRPGSEGLTLAAGESFEFGVRFQPTSTEERAVAQVELVRRDQPSPIAVSLYARGSIDPFITERWRQADFSAVDILLVIDNSRSMGAEQRALQASFPRFLDYARIRGFDYRVGVVTTDTDGESGCPETGGLPPPGVEPGVCGYLSNGSGAFTDPDWRLVEPGEQPSPEEAFRFVSDVGTGGSAAEAGLRAATLALEPTRLGGWNLGLLSRPDAFLSVLFVSDEDDQSPGDPRLYEAMLAATKGARFRERFALSGIVIDPVGCGATITSRYLQAIQRSGGTAGSICQTQYDQVIDRLARAAVGLRDRFVLRRPAYSPSVTVTTDDVPLPAISNGKRRWRFDSEGNAVVFEPDGVPREGSRVEVRYRPRCFDP